MVKLLLWLCLLMPVGVWADYFNPGGATDSSYGIIPVGQGCKIDSGTAFTVAWWQRGTAVSNVIARDETVSLKGVAITGSGRITILFLKDGTNYKRILTKVSTTDGNDGKLHNYVLTYNGGGIGVGNFNIYDNGVLCDDSSFATGTMNVTAATNENVFIGCRRGGKKVTSQGYSSNIFYGVSLDSGVVWTAKDPKVTATVYNPMLYNGQVRHHWPLINEDGKAVDYINDIGYGPKLTGRMYTVKGVAVPTPGGTTVGKAVPIFIPGNKDE